MLGPLLGVAGAFSYALMMPLIGLSLCLLAYEKRRIYPGIPLEAMVESNLLLAGFLALIWQAF